MAVPVDHPDRYQALQPLDLSVRHSVRSASPAGFQRIDPAQSLLVPAEAANGQRCLRWHLALIQDSRSVLLGEFYRNLRRRLGNFCTEQVGLSQGHAEQYKVASTGASLCGILAYEKYQLFIHVWPFTIPGTQGTGTGVRTGLRAVLVRPSPGTDGAVPLRATGPVPSSATACIDHCTIFRAFHL